MNKKLNYTNAKLTAHKKGCAPQTEIKKRINYRTAENRKNCKNCNNKSEIFFNSKRIQCRVIGEGYIKAANIELDKTCDFWEIVNNK